MLVESMCGCLKFLYLFHHRTIKKQVTSRILREICIWNYVPIMVQKMFSKFFKVKKNEKFSKRHLDNMQRGIELKKNLNFLPIYLHFYQGILTFIFFLDTKWLQCHFTGHASYPTQEYYHIDIFSHTVRTNEFVLSIFQDIILEQPC